MTPVTLFCSTASFLQKNIDLEPVSRAEVIEFLDSCVTTANLAIGLATRENYRPNEARRALRATRQLTAKLNRIVAPPKRRKRRAKR
jgi:hypothetical protein